MFYVYYNYKYNYTFYVYIFFKSLLPTYIHIYIGGPHISKYNVALPIFISIVKAHVTLIDQL